MDDTVQIRCTKCKSQFRDRARKVLGGIQGNAPDAKY